MFVETGIALAALGFGACWLLFARPARRENEIRRMVASVRSDREARNLMDELDYRRGLRVGEHKGTPYRAPYVSPLPNELERVLVSIDQPTVDEKIQAADTAAHNLIGDVFADNDRWSRKAPAAPTHLRSVT